jgi:hypothetical protein
MDEDQNSVRPSRCSRMLNSTELNTVFSFLALLKGSSVVQGSAFYDADQKLLDQQVRGCHNVLRLLDKPLPCPDLLQRIVHCGQILWLTKPGALVFVRA